MFSSRTSRPIALAVSRETYRVGGSVEAVATHAVGLGHASIDRVRVRGLRQRVVEGGIEDRDVREQGEGDPCGGDPGEVRRIVQGRERAQQRDVALDVVGDDGGGAELAPALDHPVADDDQVFEVDAASRGGERFDDRLDRLGVVGHALDEAGRERLGPRGVDDLVLDGTRTAVEDEGDAVPPDRHAVPPAASICWAWIAVMATVLTMSCTVAPLERSLTGLRRP